MEDDVNTPITPTKEMLQRMRNRSEYWEQRLHDVCLPPWRDTMLDLASQCSFVDDRINTIIEFGAMQSALASLLANMLQGFAMTASQGKPERTGQAIAMTLAEMQTFIAHGSKQAAEGILDDVQIVTLRNGQPIPFDFRNHLKPATSKPDSGRASPDGVGGA